MDDKFILRKRAKNIRKTLDIESISRKIREKLIVHPFYKNATNVMIFYPTKYEINLLDLVKSSDKNFFLPRVNGLELDVCEFCEDTLLAKSELNILEPCSNSVSPNLLDLVIVPALMADRQGYRLGYGGGFYDRFLSKFKKDFKTIVVVPEKLFVDELPIDEFDQKIDDVVVG